MKKSIVFISFILNLLFCLCLSADTLQPPEWYKLKANLEEPPLLGKTLSLNVEIQALIGDLNNINIRLILPEEWSVDSNEKKIKSIESGKKENIIFSIVPKTALAQGSIIVEATFDIPKGSINKAIDKMTTDKSIADSLKSNVKSWQSPTKRYIDTSFAIFPEESFYPLSNDMWVNYADEMSPASGFKGPVYYTDSMISLHQAQTDVEMFNKLTEMLKTDDSLKTNITKTGINLDTKRFNYLNGLYILAIDSWKNDDYKNSLNFIEQLEKESINLNKSQKDYLKISTENLKALIYWKQGQKHLAEEAFKNAFSQNRKHKLQRYILRNLGLFMFSKKDKATAQQMYELAKGFKKGYTLLDKEIELIKK